MSNTWDDTVILVGAAGFAEDELGQQSTIPTEREVCCSKRSVPRGEFYMAGQNGIEVSVILIVHPYEYEGENTVLFEGKRLRVVKTYQISLEELELTCSEKMVDKNEKRD